MKGVSGEVSRGLLGLTAVCACACAGAAFAAPAGPVVNAGSASYDPATLTVTTATARTQISWQSFSVASSELVTFIQPNAQSTVLNQVFDAQSLNILGGLRSNGSVFFLANGRLLGEGMNLDLAGAISTSLRLPPMVLAARGDASPNRLRPLATLEDGSIFVISEDEQAVTAADGDVVLNPGRTVELARAVMPHLRVGITAPDTEAISLSRLVAAKRATGMFAGLFRVPAAARHAVQRQAGPVTMAFAPEAIADAERFYGYARLFAQMQREAAMMRVAALPGSSVLLRAARSRPSLLPREIQIGAPAAREQRQPAPTADLQDSAASAPPAATTEPRPLPELARGEPAPASATALALAAAEPPAEMVAVRAAAPIAVASAAQSENAAVLALAAAEPPAEMVAVSAAVPIAIASAARPENAAVLALAAAEPPAELVATPLPAPIQVARVPLRSGPTLIVVALAQHGAAPPPQEESRVKEVRVERRAPRYFTDYRGALFFM